MTTDDPYIKLVELLRSLSGKTIHHVDVVIDDYDYMEEATIFLVGGTKLKIIATYNNDRREGYFIFKKDTL